MHTMTNEQKILKELEENRGTSVSGEKLAASLNISRAAVWKHIKKLRDEGYKIDAVNNLGYCLGKDDDKLSKGAIAAYLDNPGSADKLFVYDNIDSTNTEAKRKILDGADSGTVIVADSQKSGRGRMGRSFYSPGGTGVYLSYIIRPRFSAEDALKITAAAAVAVCRAIEDITVLKPRIKWVNDLYLDDKKICGILTEAVSGLETGNIDAVVIGIGINCTTVFGGELAQKAGSLCVGAIRNRLAAELINQLNRIEDTIKDEFIGEYRERSLVIGKNVTIPTEPGSIYYAEDIGDSGELILIDEDKNKRILNTGEVSIRPLKGESIL